jgi:hypothetical protein
MLIMLLFFILVVLAFGGGSWGFSRFGWVSMSPAAVVFLVLAILYFTGCLR